MYHTTFFQKAIWYMHLLFVLYIVVESIYIMTDILLTVYQPCVKEKVIHGIIYINCLMQL